MDKQRTRYMQIDRQRTIDVCRELKYRQIDRDRWINDKHTDRKII